MGWKIDFDGAVLREEDVTGAQVIVVTMTIGDSSWDALNPMASPSNLCAWTALAVAEHTKQPLETALMYVQQQPLLKVLSTFHANPTPEPEPSPAEDGFNNDRDRELWRNMVAANTSRE